MRTLSAAIIAVLAVIGGSAYAQNHLPAPYAASEHPPPASFHCPTPYVEMIPGKSDQMFSRAWHCRETEHSLGLIRSGNGACGGSKGLAMFKDWIVPATRATSGSRDEIIAKVIDPCYRELAKAHAIEGISDQQLIEMVKMTQAENIDASVEAVQTLLRQVNTSDGREMIFELAKQACIEAAKK